MWGIFGKPLKRAIWNTLGLHAVLTVCLIFLSFLDGTCQQAATMSAYKFTPRAVASPDAPQKGLPQADYRFSDANRPHTETVHLAPVGGRRALPYNVWIHWLQKEDGLWAMPLNTGWVPVKARRLQD